MNLQEMYAKKEELRNEGKAAVKAGNKEKADEVKVQLDNLENEIKAEILFVDDEQKRSTEAQAKALMEADKINKGLSTLTVVNNIGKTEEKNGVESTEYYNAFIDEMQNKATTEQKQLISELNAHTTGDTGILVPNTIVEGIWTKVDELYPLWRAIPKVRANGAITIQRNIGSTDVLGWVEENQTTPMTQFEFENFDLNGHEISLGIEVSFKLSVMSRRDFVAHIQSELAKKLGYQLSTAVYRGTGTGMGYGIKTRLQERATDRIINYTELGYSHLTQLFAKIKSGLLNATTIYANNVTIWTILANLTDDIGRPLLLQAVRNGQVGTIFGISVVEAGELPDGDILIANMGEGMRCGINKDITAGHELDNRKRISAHFLHAIVDFDVFDDTCFALLESSGGVAFSAISETKAKKVESK